MDHSVNGPPKAGPKMPPSRKPDWKEPLACPRWSGSATRSRRLRADTVNMAEPTPPIPRSSNSCGKDCANPANRLETATMPMPVARMTRSPSRLTRLPPAKAETKRISAKTLITDDAARLETPNVFANTGIAGARMPKPSATKNATAVSTATSRGSPYIGRRWTKVLDSGEGGELMRPPSSRNGVSHPS